MKSMTKMAVALSAVGLLATATPSFALPLLTLNTGANGIQTFNTFGGFDFISNATAISTPFAFDGSTMTTSYLASANAILDPGGNPFITTGINPPGSGGWEITIKATLFETATCSVFAGGTCKQALFTATGGSYDIYFDSTSDANRTLGTGYADGTKIISGTINIGEAGSFLLTNDLLGGSGNFSFDGSVVFVETDNTKDAYIDPTLVNGIGGAEIKIGTKTTGWTPPTTWVDGLGGSGAIPADYLKLQADGNIAFVPEPGSLALMGLGLLGLFGGTRRRKV